MSYDLDAMKSAIAKCDKNIALFEKAIADELVTKMQYQKIVWELENGNIGTNPTVPKSKTGNSSGS